MDEVWVKIKGFNNLFDISDQGNIRRLCKDGEFHIQKPYETKSGRLKIELQVDIMIEGYVYYVDELVSRYFMDEPKSGQRLIHINGDKADNRLCNLSWIDKDQDLRKSGHILRNFRSVNQYDTMGALVGSYCSIREASRVTGKSYQGIMKCCSHQQSSCGGYLWEYSDSGLTPTLSECQTCPHCGSPAEVKLCDWRGVLSEGLTHYMVLCTGCGARSRPCSTRDEAVATWNKCCPRTEFK